MPRPNRTGIRGLRKDEKTGRYVFDLRFADPKTGEPARHQETFAVGLSFAAAKERARTLVNSLLTGTFERDRASSKRLCDAFEEYLAWADEHRVASADDRRDHANSIIASIGRDTMLDAISPRDVERFKTERVKAGRKPGTINRHLATLKHFIGLACDWGWIARERALALRRVKLTKEPPGRVRYLHDAEAARLFTEADEDLRNAILVACLTGMRRAELVGLRWSNVDLAAATITLTKTKANRTRRIPIHPDLLALLKPLREGASADGPVLTRAGKAWSPHTLSIQFARLTKESGVTDLHLHDLRHDFATRLCRGGTPINVVATLLGHSTLTTTQRYAHVEDRTLRGAVGGLVFRPATLDASLRAA